MTEPNNAAAKVRIKSADRTLQILSYIAQHQPVGMKEIRDGMAIPRSSLHGLLGVLQDHGFIGTDQLGRYLIGLRAFEVGSSWQKTVGVESAAAPVLRDLVAEVKQIAHVGVLDGTDIVYIMKQENERPVRLVSAVGRRLPCHATALGKVLLSPFTEQQIHERFNVRELPAMTPSTITDLDQLIAVVEEVRHRGYCIDRGESTVGVTCYAGPIRDLRGSIIAALSVSVIDADPLIKSEAEYVAAVTGAARSISARLGYREAA